MESLITEPGPRNPLLFLALSLVNRIPGYKPDEKETLNQLECMNDLISSVSASVFRLDSVKNAVVVAVDALITISMAETKKSVAVRVSALSCLKLLVVDKVAACGVSNLMEILPGILSKMVKICTGRVDVEVDDIMKLALQIIDCVIQCFWDEQATEEAWASFSSLTPDALILLKQKYRDNVDMVVCSLKPVIKSRKFNNSVVNVFNSHLKGCLNPSSTCIKLALLLNINASLDPKRIVQVYNAEIVEWFQVNGESLNEIHEEVLMEKVQMLLGLMSLKNSHSFLLFSDLFSIVKLLTGLKVSIGDTVSIEYSDSSYGIDSVLKGNTVDRFIGPKIVFKRALKLSKEAYSHIELLFAKITQFDAKAMQTSLLNFTDDDEESLDVVIQKIDLSSMFYKHSDCSSLELFKDCLKYHERSVKETGVPVERAQMIHLAVLKLIWHLEQQKQQQQQQTKCVHKASLLIILSAMTSDWIILRETSTQILKGIAKTDVKQFVKEHEMFLLDRLGIQMALPAFYPETPKIISCLVRDILDPSSALKFTDLLVKKVSENLALYQRHAGYCKDLLAVAEETVQVVSKIDAVEFIDPKKFAFTSMDDDEKEQDSPVLNCQQRIILDLLKIGINFILSDSKSIRVKSMDLIKLSTINFIKYHDNSGRESSDLCQLIHAAWPNMIAVVKDSLRKDALQLDVAVIESFAGCCRVLFDLLPLFMRDRFVKDFWKTTMKPFSTKQHTDNYPAFSKICKLLIGVLNAGIVYCKPSTEICIDIIDVLGDKNDSGLFESISQIEPDLLWYFYSCELGGIAEIKSVCPELKSFKVVPTCKHYNNLSALKQQLKQFIY